MGDDEEETPQNGVGERKASGRLPKYRRAGEAFGKIEITERDERLLELVHEYRYMQAQQVAAVLGGNERQIARRLQALYHHEYLERLVPPSKMRLAGSPKMTYVLDQAGAEHLARNVYQCAMKDLGWRAQHKRRTEWFVEHHVAISEFHASLELACRHRPDLELEDWRQDQEAHGECSWRLPQWRAEETFRVAPDAYCAVIEGGVRRNLFLELDRGTEEQGRIFEKLERYAWYLGHPDFRQKYPDRSEDVRVLVVTSGEERMRGMLATLTNLVRGYDYKGQPYRKVPGLVPGRFWFTTSDQYSVAEPEGVLRPIWRTVTKGESLALV